MIFQKILKVRVSFIEEVLGSSSNNPKLHEQFIASKAEEPHKIKEEMDSISVDEKIDLARTIFPKLDDGTPFSYDYQWKGFFKDATKALKPIKGTESSKIKAYKQYIDNRIFVFPRKIPFNFAEDGQYEDGSFIGSCQRPLRASTPQGERNSLADSESIKAGAWCEFEVKLLLKDDEDWIKELFDYGQLRGFSQWRNSGKGRFVFEILDENGTVIGGNKAMA